MKSVEQCHATPRLFGYRSLHLMFLQPMFRHSMSGPLILSILLLLSSLNMTTFAQTVERPLTDFIGERISVLAYGAKGDGVTDDADAINKAIAQLVALKGRNLLLPGGRTYLVKSPITI